MNKNQFELFLQSESKKLEDYVRQRLSHKAKNKSVTIRNLVGISPDNFHEVQKQLQGFADLILAQDKHSTSVSIWFQRGAIEAVG